MPIADIMNQMNSNRGAQGYMERPVDRDLALSKGYADVGATMASTAMEKHKLDTLKNRQSILENFEGRTNTPEFASKMNTVDPDLVMKMQERAENMDKSQRAALEKKFKQVATMAAMADNPQAWKEAGFQQPFSEREKIMSYGMTMSEVFTYKGVGKTGKGGDGEDGEDWTMKAADSNSIKDAVRALYKGTYGPDGSFNFANKEAGMEAAKVTKRASEIYRRGRGKTSHNEAAYLALQEITGRSASETDATNKPDPMGLRGKP